MKNTSTAKAVALALSMSAVSVLEGMATRQQRCGHAHHHNKPDVQKAINARRNKNKAAKAARSKQRRSKK